MGTALALGPVPLILILDRAIRMWAYHPGVTVIRLGRLLGVLLLAHRIQSMEQTALAGTARFSPEQAGAGGPHGAGGDGERGVIGVRAGRRPRAGPSDCGRPATDRRTQVSPGYLEAPDPPPRDPHR